MFTIEFTGSAPNPWRVTTDDNVTWDTRSELDAAVELAQWIYDREQQSQPEPEPALPPGAVLI